MQSTFVQNSSGSWDLYVNNEPFGVTFEIPDGYTMMAYKFFLSNDEINSVKACKDVVFVLDEPHKMRSIVIDAEANTRFLNGLKVKVTGTLTLGKNFNLALSRNSQEKNPKMPKFNDLIIKNNENTIINFEDRTKKLNSRELYQLSKDGVYPYSRNMVQNNANLNLSLAVDTKSIYIAENMDPIKRNISLSFGQAGYIFLRLARLNSDARDSTLTIDSDIIKLEESILNITGNNSFVMRNDNDKPTVIDSEYVKNMELSFDGTNVTIDAQTVNFDWWKTPSSNTEHAPSVNFHGENSFVAKNIVVFESNNRFVNSKVISHKTLSFKGMSNAIMDSEISFSEKNQNYSEIKDFISRDSTLSDVSGTLTGSINSVKGEEITIKEGGQFNILPANAQETGVSTYLSSLTIEEGSELSIGANGADKKTISLSNVKVSNGNNIKEGAFLKLYDYSNQENPLKRFSNSTVEGGVEINNNVDYTIESSLLKSGKMEIKAGDKINRVLIDNSILEGDNVLYNVSELSCSEVRDSELDLKEPAKISNQLLSFEDIDDYEAYQRAQEPKLEEIKKDVGQITTEDWEVL